jgi:hypothetical protein
MKQILVGLSAAAALAFAAPVSAQVYTPYSSLPTSSTYYHGPITPEMMDDGSSSDFPTHIPSDFVADQLNRQVLENNNTIYYPTLIYPVPLR